MYFRVKRSGAYPYLQVVQSYRDGQQVRQHVIATLGRLDVLQATGQMDRLIRSGVRNCEGNLAARFGIRDSCQVIGSAVATGLLVDIRLK